MLRCTPQIFQKHIAYFLSLLLALLGFSRSRRRTAVPFVIQANFYFTGALSDEPPAAAPIYAFRKCAGIV